MKVSFKLLIECPLERAGGIAMKKYLYFLPICAVLALVLGVGSSSYLTSGSCCIEKYMELAGKYYGAGEYEKALEYYASALELDDTLAEAYRMSSDAYLEQEKCEEAVQILMDGVEITGAEELSEREMYLRENIVVTESILKVLSYDPDRHDKYFKPSDLYMQTKSEYDENGNMTKEVWYDGNGKEWYRKESEYDTNGNLIKTVIYDVDAEDGNMEGKEEREYDVFGNMLCGHYSCENNATDALGNDLNNTALMYSSKYAIINDLRDEYSDVILSGTYKYLYIGE